jgi:purine-binding chemotaxis protein CheW
MVESQYLSGLFTAESRMVTLLDVARLFAVETGDDDALGQRALTAERPH